VVLSLPHTTGVTLKSHVSAACETSLLMWLDVDSVWGS